MDITERKKYFIAQARKLNLIKSQKDLGVMLGYSNESSFSQMIGKDVPFSLKHKEILKTLFPDLNIEWLDHGKGQLWLSESNKEIVPVEINNKELFSMKRHAVPVIPRHIYEDPDVDVYEYVNENVEPTSPRIMQLPDYSMCYHVYSDELVPNIIPGDRLYIKPHINVRKIIDGKPYILETSTNGLMLRMLYKGDTGLRASTNSSKYRDEYVPYDDVVRVYQILGLLRANI